MSVISALSARYCVRQDAHAFMWLWGLLLILIGAALALRRSSWLLRMVLLAFALGTVALGAGILYACTAYAPLSLGLAVPISATDLTRIMCLSKDPFGTAIPWTVVVLSCSGAVALVLRSRASGKTATSRAFAYIGAALLVVIAVACVLLAIFSFGMCGTTWVY